MNGAHDSLISAAHRAQADALEIEAAAKRRLADEYDAAQERGEVKRNGGDRVSSVSKQNSAPNAADIGLTRKQIHEAREIRDAEKRDPGVMRPSRNSLLNEAAFEIQFKDVRLGRLVRPVLDPFVPSHEIVRLIPNRRACSRKVEATSIVLLDG